MTTEKFKKAAQFVSPSLVAFARVILLAGVIAAPFVAYTIFNTPRP